jgi:DNA-binding transcriptional regulator GbsR (MarR family)
MADERGLARQNFIEDVGLFFEQAGLPRMAGRILGRLLLADPPHQSLDELAEALMASKGSISTTTRLLIQIGLIERFSLPGVRHDYFRIRPDAFQHALKHGAEEITRVRKLAERGLQLLEGEPPQVRQGLQEMYDMYTFIEQEYSQLLERWEQEREKLQQESVRQKS